MKLHIDLETLQLIEGPGFRNPVTALRFKRGDSATMEVTFLQGGSTPASIGDPGTLEIRFGIKPRNRYDVSYLVHSADWTMPAPDAESPVYLCSPSFNTVELDSALGVGSSTGTELSEITLMGEITWREGAGEPTSTRTFLVIVENDVNRGTEGVPTDADPAYPSPESILLKAELDQRAVRYDAAQTALNAAQLSQFLNNLGRSGGHLDLTGGGSRPTTLRASGLELDSIYATGNLTTPAFGFSDSSGTPMIDVNGYMVVWNGVFSDNIYDTLGGLAISAQNRELIDDYANAAAWWNDGYLNCYGLNAESSGVYTSGDMQGVNIYADTFWAGYNAGVTENIDFTMVQSIDVTGGIITGVTYVP